MFTLDFLKPVAWPYQLEVMCWRGEIDDFEALYSVVWDYLIQEFQNEPVRNLRGLPDGLADLAVTMARIIWSNVHK